MPTVLAADGPNAEQIAYWNEHALKWVTLQAHLDLQLGPLGRRAMDRAAIAAGEHILDVGCGCGDTTLELARRATAAGSALGIDISTQAIERARHRAGETGLANVRFANADAQTFAFAPARRSVPQVGPVSGKWRNPGSNRRLVGADTGNPPLPSGAGRAR
jgi:tRNA G46 methylase TrmB